MSATTLSNPRGIATVSLPGILESKLRTCAATGFTHIELFEDDVLRYPHPLPQLRKLCSDLGLTICMYQPFRDLGEWALRSDFDLALARLKHKFRWMDDLGCDTILVVSNCQPKSLCTDDFETSISQYREAAEVAAQQGKRIAFEALAWGTNINLWRQSWDVVRSVDHPAFGLCLDSFHIYSRGDNVDGLGDIPAEKIFIVQLADAPYLQMHVLEWSRHFRSFPGQGEMPIVSFMEELRKTGYDGILSLEVFSDNIRNGDLTQLTKDAMRSLEFLDRDVAPKPLGIEFIEFAVSDGAIAAMGSFLFGLGFIKAGAHRSKNVQWWNNGAVSVVLNAEPASHASHHLLTHDDISVCALAIRVASAPSTISRAAELGYPIIRSPKLALAASEANIEAIQMPGDMLAYIVDTDSFWGQDFEVEPGFDSKKKSATQTVYSGLDSVTQALQSLPMVESCALFWHAVFGMSCKKAPDVQDPLGLVSAWTISAPEMPRLALNVPHTNSSCAGLQVHAANSFAAGSDMHMIALHTNDIFIALESIQETSLLCSPPEKYYEDLQYKYGLKDDYVTQLKDGNVMYEKTLGGGELLSVFTRTVNMDGAGVYFQIVQRKDGYEGVGSTTNGLALQCSVLHCIRRISTRATETNIPTQIYETQHVVPVWQETKVKRPLIGRSLGKLWERASVVFTTAR